MQRKELKGTANHVTACRSKVLLSPQGFRPEAKSRGGTLVTRAYIKDSTYSSNTRKNLDLLEQGPRGIGR